jgi:hypothetical protein
MFVAPKDDFPLAVTAGLDRAVHSELPYTRHRRMDARVKPAHDE